MCRVRVCDYFNSGEVRVSAKSRQRGKLSSSGPGPVPGQVQKVQGLRTKDLDLG